MKEGCKECGNDEEIKILDEYLPSLYTEDHLGTIISDYILKEAIEYKKDMGKIMKWLKDNHLGKYDGKIASAIVNKKLV